MSPSKRSRNPDHVRPLNRPSPPNEAIEARIKSLLSSTVFSQGAYYRGLGLRERVLNLPVMVASVLMLLWRQVPSVHEMTRMLAREDLLGIYLPLTDCEIPYVVTDGSGRRSTHQIALVLGGVEPRDLLPGGSACATVC